MEIFREDILSWEPLEIRLIPEIYKDDWGAEVFLWLKGWEQARTELAPHLETSQIPLEYYVAGVESDGTVVIHIEWLCEESLIIFVRYLEDVGSNIKALRIGQDIEVGPLHRPAGLEVDFLRIPDKTITLESDEVVEVDSFEIAKYPVTVRQFDHFVKSINYITDSEKQGQDRTYRDNDCLVGMLQEEKLSSAATCVSYNDARAYCTWSGLRLPSDAEWLASSVMDWETVYGDIEDVPDAIRDRYLSMEQALRGLGAEWVKEFDPESNCSKVRYGPEYFLFKGWQSSGLIKWHAADYTDLLFQFRVCK